MGSLSQAKTLGGVGAILMIVGGFVPYVGIAIVIAGLVMVYLGVKNISEVANDPQIKSDFTLYVIMAIIAAAVIFALPFVVIGSFGAGITPFASTEETFDDLGAIIAICAVMLIIAFVFYVLSAVYLKKSFTRIADYTGVSLFKTTGFIYLLGAVLTIILVGIFLMWIAYILMIVAFFSLPDTIGPSGQPGMSSQGQGRVCPNCGRPIPMDAQVCPYCGKDFRQL